MFTIFCLCIILCLTNITHLLFCLSHCFCFLANVFSCRYVLVCWCVCILLFSRVSLSSLVCLLMLSGLVSVLSVVVVSSSIFRISCVYFWFSIFFIFLLGNGCRLCYWFLCFIVRIDSFVIFYVQFCHHR